MPTVFMYTNVAGWTHWEAVTDGDELRAASAEVEHDAVAQRRRVDRCEIAVVRFLVRRQHPDRESGCRACAADHLLAVRGVADRARGDNLGVLRCDAARPAVSGEDVERVQPAGDRGRAQPARAADA